MNFHWLKNSSLLQQSLRHKKAATKPEVVEITSEEGGSEVGERPSTEAIVEEPMTEEPGVEQESADDSIPKESGGEQGVSITPSGMDTSQ